MSTIESLNAHNFHHEIEETAGVSLVFFSHALCGSCRGWKQLLQSYSSAYDDIKIFEVDAESEMALTNEFEVFHLPALFLYKDGQFHAPFESIASVDEINQNIRRLLKLPAREMP